MKHLTSYTKEELQAYIIARSTKMPSGCWHWNMASKDAYGSAFSRNAHVISFMAFKGEPGFLVRHLCYNKCCVNPEHLASGDSSDNKWDEYFRGNMCGAKLTLEQIKDIKCLHLRDLKGIAERLGMSYAAVRRCWAGITWERLGEVKKPTKRKNRPKWVLQTLKYMDGK